MTTIFLAQDPVRCKIIMVNKSLQQLKNLKYLGSEISYENEKYVHDKLAKFSQILRILNNNCKQTLV